MKKKILNSMIVVGMLAMTSGSVFAASPSAVQVNDVFGDSMINLPMDESTVSTNYADVWFVKINEAYAYSVDIVGAGKNGDMALACDNAGSNQHRTSSYNTIILASDLSCDETTKTKPGDTNTVGILNPGLRLCNWTSPIMVDGQYAMAINPILVGGVPTPTPLVAPFVTNGSIQEVRWADAGGTDIATCENMDDPILGPAINGVDADDRVAITSNTFANMSTDVVDNSGAAPGDGILDNHGHYQVFEIKSTLPVATQVPNAAEPESPIAIGNNIPSYSTLPGFGFEDDSGAAGAATWYELFIWDKDQKRITSYGSYSSAPNWYKVGVDGQLQCSIVANASGKRICTLSDIGAPPTEQFNTAAFAAELASYSVNDEFTWWIRGYNALGYAAWSSAPGVFVK